MQLLVQVGEPVRYVLLCPPSVPFACHFNGRRQHDQPNRPAKEDISVPRQLQLENDVINDGCEPGLHQGVRKERRVMRAEHQLRVGLGQRLLAGLQVTGHHGSGWRHDESGRLN